MKRLFALTLSVILMITLLCNGIVTFADEDNRVYLGTTTCYNDSYTADFRYILDDPNHTTALTSYYEKDYYFISEESGMYSFVINSEQEAYSNGYGLKINSGNSNIFRDYVSKTVIIHLDKGEKLSFSFLSTATQNDDLICSYNGKTMYYNTCKDYSVTINKKVDSFEINKDNTRTYIPSSLKGDCSKYIVNSEEQTAKMLLYLVPLECEESEKYIIPTTVLGCKINAIGEYAFSAYDFEEIHIPGTITNIDNYAFTNCYKLKRVVIDNPYCVYGKNAFFNCREDLQIIGGKMGDASGGESGSVSIVSADILGVKNKTYTGKAIAQNIAVAIDDESLTKGEDYTVSYSNNKKVGTATITVTGIGNYYGNIKKTFKINPKGTSIKSISSRSKGFYLKWNKQATQTSGYQIKYSTDKNFGKNNKTIDVSSNKTTSKTVKKLSKSKKYYVKVRTYKIVNGKAYFSAWSSAKSIKTKR